MSKPITIAMIYKEIARLDPKMSIGSDSFKAAVVMLSALSVGTDIKKLSKFTELPTPLIRRFSKNLTTNGVWKNGDTHGDWFKKKEGVIAFFLDVNVALGYVERSKT